MNWFTKTAILLVMMIGIIRSQEDHQTELAGGPCEGCEAVFEYGDRILLPVDTLPDFFQEGTRLRITGTIYQSDGKTPASGVILSHRSERDL
jgi:protocatechuate 3,4-dioxygenase beta subunit